MKKCLFFTSLFCLLSIATYSQFRIGLKLSPSLSTNRIEYDSDTLDINTNGVGLKFIFGPTFNFGIGENYYFSTGLFYATKRVGVKYNSSSMKGEETYGIQYVQIPATIKLYTNELAVDTRIYFDLGVFADIKIDEKAKDDDNILIDDFKFFDFGAQVGVGVEFKMGTNTNAFGGFSYRRGFINVLSDAIAKDDGFILKNDMLSLDIGILF